jgi:hypothetical protein
MSWLQISAISSTSLGSRVLSRPWGLPSIVVQIIAWRFFYQEVKMKFGRPSDFPNRNQPVEEKMRGVWNG